MPPKWSRCRLQSAGSCRPLVATRENAKVKASCDHNRHSRGSGTERRLDHGRDHPPVPPAGGPRYTFYRGTGGPVRSWRPLSLREFVIAGRVAMTDRVAVLITSPESPTKTYLPSKLWWIQPSLAAWRFTARKRRIQGNSIHQGRSGTRQTAHVKYMNMIRSISGIDQVNLFSFGDNAMP